MHKTGIAAIVTVALLGVAGAWQGSGIPAGGHARGLQVAFVDVEGGAATLVVTPAGESLLFDSGWPGDRDADRIAAEAKRLGVTRIDHYVVSHWHRDHVGGSADVAKRLPVGQTYGHAIPDPLPQDILPELMTAWRGMAGTPRFLSAGDAIELRGAPGTPTPRLRILAADGAVLGEKAGAPQVRACGAGDDPRPEDPSDNARSLAWHLSYGDFDLFSGGDLTWNVEHKLTCPPPAVGPVDVYLANHHGLDTSNHPALIDRLAPRVSIVNNGARKGGEPRSIAHLLKVSGEDATWQLHRAVRDGAVNTRADRIANEAEACSGNPLHLHVTPDGTRYTVSAPASGTKGAYHSTP